MPENYVTRGEFEHYKERDLERQDAAQAKLGAKLDDLKDYITQEFKELRAELLDRYATKEEVAEIKREAVTKHEFVPVRRLVYGAVGIILTAVIGGVVALIIAF